MVLALGMSLAVGIGIGYAASNNSDPTPGVPGPGSKLMSVLKMLGVLLMRDSLGMTAQSHE